MESKSVTDTALMVLRVSDPILCSVRATLENSASRSVRDAVWRRHELWLGAMSLLPVRPTGMTKRWLEMAPSCDARVLWCVRCDARDPARMDGERPESKSGKSGMDSSGSTKTMDADPESLVVANALDCVAPTRSTLSVRWCSSQRDGTRENCGTCRPQPLRLSLSSADAAQHAQDRTRSG